MVLIFIYGLIIGSFLNVVISRLNTKKSMWWGRSACPQCGHQLAWYDNVPIFSFLILKGKCRHCSKIISWQYILVELATATIFTWLYWNFGLSAEFFIYSIFACFLIVIFVYDLLHYLILDKVSLPAMGVALAGSWYLEKELWPLVIGGLVGAGFFAGQYFITGFNLSFLKNKKSFFEKNNVGRWVGGGDIRLGAVMGLMLGLPTILAALFIAYILGSVIGLTLIAVKQKQMSSQVPFGPFLAAATLVALIYGQILIDWYLGVLS